ncbi:phosphoglucosamine mutase [Alicyclobacillus cycloheptanicus]|uniref:Phosphoglucosamine mutase n=1 Tax=Alicyclobacillus cycloheptanicus TaxID=1457 RepID=A0ABT9XJF7_9BACL|nr:phosphoglucosamine mutase [Alicyclobacillus cycloheptanicus]MDQ0190448.1 phosphoglucosamine mutase [Alicyclobacillus cycloheptanicus]WDM02687.1 phosphoglucosamine mutase [Alicyclobacillus cycloheptanicus]
MSRLFGTDGVRGVANRDLTPELAFRLGRVGAYLLTGSRPGARFVIGKDTRVSGDMLEAALLSGILSMGVDALRVGIMSTPGVAYLTKHLHADAGVMISASHNPVEDNGIKFFGGDGFKLLDDVEDEFERLMNAAEDALPRPEGVHVGRVYEEPGHVAYEHFLQHTVDRRFDGLHVVLDCANGAAYSIAPAVFEKLGAKVTVLNNTPDGTNINVGCGSTHPHVVQRAVLELGADVGLAFDGDADRLIAVDESGGIVDGDFILAISAKWLHDRGQLKNDTVVATVMSNVGFVRAMEANGITVQRTAVGDRYVMEAMRQNHHILGGEQSGHIIYLNHTTTGDGILTALQLVNIMVEQAKPLSELATIMVRYPQILENVRVRDKQAWRENARIQEALRSGETLLGEDGRVLVRESGTEPIVRVMAEGPDEGVLRRCVADIVKVVKEELGA